MGCGHGPCFGVSLFSSWPNTLSLQFTLIFYGAVWCVHMGTVLIGWIQRFCCGCCELGFGCHCLCYVWVSCGALRRRRVVVRSLGGPAMVGMPLDSSHFCATMFFLFRVTMSDVSFSWPQPGLINSKPAVFPPCPQGESLSRCPGVAPFQAIILPRLGPLAAVHQIRPYHLVTH